MNGMLRTHVLFQMSQVAFSNRSDLIVQTQKMFMFMVFYAFKFATLASISCQILLGSHHT